MSESSIGLPTGASAPCSCGRELSTGVALCPRCGATNPSFSLSSAVATASAAARSTTSPTRPQDPGARWVGDADLGGISVSRLLNAACYVVAGVALIVLTTSLGGSQTLLGVLGGLGMMAYGAKILLTRTSYWINSVVYLLVVIAVGAALTRLGG